MPGASARMVTVGAVRSGRTSSGMRDAVHPPHTRNAAARTITTGRWLRDQRIRASIIAGLAQCTWPWAGTDVESDARRTRYAPVVTTRSPAVTPSTICTRSPLRAPTVHRSPLEGLAFALDEHDRPAGVVDDGCGGHDRPGRGFSHQQMERGPLAHREPGGAVVEGKGHGQRARRRIEDAPYGQRPADGNTRGLAWHVDLAGVSLAGLAPRRPRAPRRRHAADQRRRP